MKAGDSVYLGRIVVGIAAVLAAGGVASAQGLIAVQPDFRAANGSTYQGFWPRLAGARCVAKYKVTPARGTTLDSLSVWKAVRQPNGDVRCTEGTWKTVDGTLSGRQIDFIIRDGRPYRAQ